MLGIGFLLRGYSSPVFGIDINALYIPHGIMAGASGRTDSDHLPDARQKG